MKNKNSKINITRKELKYVVVSTVRGERAIIFPIEVCHCNVYTNLDAIISAGFVLFDGGMPAKVYGCGESFKTTKLNKEIQHRERDLIVITMTMFPGSWDYTADMGKG